MPVKTYKPTSPGRRGMSTVATDDITKTKPERRLTKARSNKPAVTPLGSSLCVTAAADTNGAIER